jgi:5-methylcytosine-specific restriction endonuclease McrA
LSLLTNSVINNKRSRRSPGPYGPVSNRSEYMRRWRQSSASRGVDKGKKTNFLREYLSKHPCVDCGNSDIRVLEFDHRVPANKEFHIGYGITSKTFDAVRREIEKCDVRCGNCHVRRTHWSNGTYRNVLVRLLRCLNLMGPPTVLPSRSVLGGKLAYNKLWNKMHRQRMHNFVIEYLEDHSCLDCGEEDIRVLEFDHRDDCVKISDIGSMLRSAPFQRLKEEITKCDVRCRNCHTIKTLSGFQRHWRIT